MVKPTLLSFSAKLLKLVQLAIAVHTSSTNFIEIDLTLKSLAVWLSILKRQTSFPLAMNLCYSNCHIYSLPFFNFCSFILTD